MKDWVEHLPNIETPEDIDRLVSYDEPQNCWLCKGRHDETRDFQGTLRKMAQWWLSAEQRRAWCIDTFIEPTQPGQRRDKRNMTALFKIRPTRPAYVFFIMAQHHLNEKKKKHKPHYQLAVKFSRSELNLNEGDPISQVEELIERADQHFATLRDKGKLISLHEELPSSSLSAIQETISKLVQGLVKLDWKHA